MFANLFKSKPSRKSGKNIMMTTILPFYPERRFLIFTSSMPQQRGQFQVGACAVAQTKLPVSF
jgi:hypothetical protein